MSTQNHSKLQELDAAIRRLKGENPDADATSLILATLRTAKDKDEQTYLLSSLASEYQSLGKLPEAEEAIRNQINLAPDSPDGWIQLAGHLYRYAKDLPKALSTVELAVTKALVNGHFVRQALAERIRIALDMKNYPIVEASMLKLIEYVPKPGSLDVRLETDFLTRIPVGTISIEIVEKYRKLSGQ